MLIPQDIYLCHVVYIEKSEMSEANRSGGFVRENSLAEILPSRYSPSKVNIPNMYREMD
jgi:hypothetical protein